MSFGYLHIIDFDCNLFLSKQKQYPAIQNLHESFLNYVYWKQDKIIAYKEYFNEHWGKKKSN